MLLALVEHIDEVVPGARVMSLSTYPEADRATPRPENLEIVSFRPLEMLLLHLPLALLIMLTRALGGSGRLFLRTPALRALDDARVVADLAGISFSDGRGLPTLVYNTLMTGIPLMIGANVVKCAQALGPFERLDTRLAAQLVLPRLRQVVARGDRTLAHLTRLGLGNVELGADMAFLMSVRDVDRRAASTLTGRVTGAYFVVSPSSVVEAMAERDGIDYADLMVDLIGGIMEETGLSAVLVAHSARPGEPKSRMNDLPLVEQIGDQLQDPGVIALASSLDPRVLKAVIAGSDMLVTSRFHAMISALSSGTPTLVVGWSHKYQEVMSEFGQSSAVVPFESADADALRALAVSIHEERHRLSAEIKGGLDAVESLSRVSLEALRRAAR